jgi:hypothetical protein
VFKPTGVWLFLFFFFLFSLPFLSLLFLKQPKWTKTLAHRRREKGEYPSALGTETQRLAPDPISVLHFPDL